jgi:phosphatidylinositol dimannoside acyltransferase
MVALTRQRLRHELRDLVELVLLPAIAAFVPWRMVFAIFKRLAGWPLLYRAPSNRALAEAQQRGWVADPASWLRARKLTTLVDHADHYLARSRGNDWLDRHVEVDGQWPAPGQAAMALTFHWGAGMWGLRSAARAGLRCHALVAALDGEQFAGRAVLHRYVKARTRSVALSLRCPFIDVSTSMRSALRVLHRHEQLLAVVDVPADQVAASQATEILGLPARLPTGLLRLAVDRKIPVCVYVTGIDMESGRRFLRIRQLGVPGSVEALVATLSTQLDSLIRENPPAWHFWSEAERFFRA